MLYTWSACFPSGLKNKERKVFVTKHNLDCDADTFKNARQEYAERTMATKSSIQQRVHLETYLANQAVVDKVKEIQKEIRLSSDTAMDDDDIYFEDLGGKLTETITYISALSLVVFIRGHSAVKTL